MVGITRRFRKSPEGGGGLEGSQNRNIKITFRSAPVLEVPRAPGFQQGALSGPWSLHVSVSLSCNTGLPKYSLKVSFPGLWLRRPEWQSQAPRRADSRTLQQRSLYSPIVSEIMYCMSKKSCPIHIVSYFIICAKSSWSCSKGETILNIQTTAS